MKKIALFIACSTLILVGYFAFPNEEVHAFHTDAEMKQFKIDGLPLDSSYNGYFYAAGKCVGCHSADPDGVALVDANGEDINMIDDWRSTLMANSAKDPFWRAKVSHEILVNPMHSVDLEDKCTSCHAPLGHYAAKYDGATHYSMADLLADSTGLDGVSCGACHEQSPIDIGNLFSGEINFDTNDIIYGPYEKNVFGAPMVTYVETPAFGAHINDAGLCASCHTLITETVDLAGNYTGGEFVEQATYHEWLNSDYGLNNVTCQECHMPRIEEPVVIADNYANLLDFPKSPYGKHTLVGGNTFMLELLRDNIIELGLTANTEQFDETIENTYALLMNSTLEFEMTNVNITEDSAFFDLLLTNLAGHKFPSGYPSRRAFIEFVVLGASPTDTIFSSGTLRNDYEVVGQHPEKEDHYDVITDPSQVQIYELVLGDVNGNETTVLERADSPLKDNRLAPKGFSTTHSTYDTTRLAGLVLSDDDFNLHEGGEEGSGTDAISYRIDLGGYNGPLQVSAKVFYQALPPKWMEEMFSFSSPEIDTFRNMYFERDNTPVLIKSVALDTTADLTIGVLDQDILSVQIFPNPTNGTFQIDTDKEIIKVEIIDMLGRTIRSYGTKQSTYELPESYGLHHILITTKEGDTVVKLLMRNK